MDKRGHLFLLIIVLLPLFSLTVFAAQQAACKLPVAVVANAEEEAWALRVQEKLAENDVTLRIERAPEFVDVERTLPDLPAFVEREAVPVGEELSSAHPEIVAANRAAGISLAIPLPPQRQLSLEETISAISRQGKLLSSAAPLDDAELAKIATEYYQRLQDAGHAKGAGATLVAKDIPALRSAVTHQKGTLNFLRQLDTLHPEAQKVFLGGDGIEYLAPAHRLLSERPDLVRTHYTSRLSLATPDELRSIITKAKHQEVHPDVISNYANINLGVDEPIGLYAIMDEAIRGASAPSRESGEFYHNLEKQFATLVMGFPTDRNRALEVIAGFVRGVNLRQPVVLVDIAGRAHVQPFLLKNGIEWLGKADNWASLTDAQRVLLGNDPSLFRNARIKVHLGVTDIVDPANILHGKNIEGVYLRAPSADAGIDVFETRRFADIEPESLLEGTPRFLPSPAGEQADALLQRLVLFDEIKRGKAAPRIAPEIAAANRAAQFPVAIPPGAAKYGFTHVEELERLSDAGKSEQAWRYFIKFKDELLPEDAAKLEPFLQKNYLIQRAKVGDLEAWLGTPAGHSFLATPEGKGWYDTRKQNWLFGLFQRGRLKKGTLETPDAFPVAFIGRSKYAPKPGRELEVNSKTDAVFISAGDPEELFTPENMRAASSETNGLPSVTFIIDGKEGKKIRVIPSGSSKLPYEGDIEIGVLLDESGDMLSSLSSRIRGGKLNQDEPFPEHLLTEFNRQVAAYKKRYFTQESFDYDSLQVMNILGISPEAAKARDVRRIGAAYREEVGFLDAGQPTPQLSKLVEEGVLTPDELEKLRKGAPMVMGGMTEEDLRKVVASQRAVAVPLNDAPLEQLVTAERPDPDAIMQRLSGLFPELRPRFDASAGVHEGYTIREHTHRVYGAFSRQAAQYPFDAMSVPEGADVPRLLKTAIALHDLGKPDAIAAGGKHLQHEFTVKILTEKLRALGFSDAETNLAEALVGNDVIGDLVKQLITEKQAYEQIAALAKKAGMPPDDFYLLQKLFYVSDASSYPLLEQEVFKKIGQSTRLDNHELLKFEKEYFPVARKKQSMHFVREEARRRGYSQLAARYDTFIRDEQLGVPAYYHTTSKDNLEGLFSGGSIEVRRGKAVPGAWVSNKPVTGVPYDNFVLILDDRLDRLPALYSDEPPLVQAFSTGEEWLGFQVPIPLRQHLAGIIVPEEEMVSVQKLLRSHGFDVPVFNTEEGLIQAEIYHTLNTFLKPEKEGILIPHSFEDAFPRAGKTEEDIRSYFTTTLNDQGRRGQLAGRVFVLPDSVGVANYDALGGTLFEFVRNPASGKWEFVTKRRIIFEGASSADRVNLVDEIILPAMRKGDGIFSDEDTRVGLKSVGEIKEIGNELGKMKFSSPSLSAALPSPAPRIIGKTGSEDSVLYDRLGVENAKQIFYPFGDQGFYGAKAVSVLGSDGRVYVAFAESRTGPVNHQNIRQGLKKVVWEEERAQDITEVDIHNMAESFGFQFQYDPSSRKIVGIEHSSKLTEDQTSWGWIGGRFSEDLVKKVEQAVIDSIDPALLDESILRKPVNKVMGKRGDLPIETYDELQVRRILGISGDAYVRRGIDKIAAAYKSEVGFLDSGAPTPQLTKLVDEGVLTPDELEKLRKGAPMVMGGMVEEDLRKAVSSAPNAGLEKIVRDVETTMFTGQIPGKPTISARATTRVNKNTIDEYLIELTDANTGQPLVDQSTGKSFKGTRGIVDLEKKTAYIWEKELDVHHTMAAASILEQEGKSDLAARIRNAQFIPRADYDNEVLRRFQGFEFMYDDGVYNFAIHSKLTTRQMLQKVQFSADEIIEQIALMSNAIGDDIPLASRRVRVDPALVPTGERDKLRGTQVGRFVIELKPFSTLKTRAEAVAKG